MRINIELVEADLKELVMKHIQERLGEIPLDKSRVSIKVKSKQNYKSEWEEASFKAEYNDNI